MLRLQGRKLSSDPYPEGSTFRRWTDLFEANENGDPNALIELEKIEKDLSPLDKLYFYRMRQQVILNRRQMLDPEMIPDSASDEVWAEVMKEAVQNFQEIGQKLQEVERERDREAQLKAAAPSKSEKIAPSSVIDEVG